MPRMRIRQVKPEYFDDDDLGQIDVEARYLGIGLICFADDGGYFLANPRLIRSRLFPIDGDSMVQKIVAWLEQLMGTGFIQISIGRDRKLYGRIPNFRKHQYIQKPQPSVLEKRWSEASTLTGDRLQDAISGIFRYDSVTSTVSVSPGSDRIGSDRIGSVRIKDITTTCRVDPPAEEPEPESEDVPIGGPSSEETSSAGEPPEKDDLPLSKEAIEKINVDAVVLAWNEVAKQHGLKGTRGMKIHRKQIATRLRDKEFFDHWRECCDILMQGPVSAHLQGQNDREWVADLDWFLTQKAFRKILDGGWTQSAGSGPKVAQRRHDLSGFKEVGDGF